MPPSTRFHQGIYEHKIVPLPVLPVSRPYPVFSPRAAQQFAAHFGAPDCTTATTQLATQVTHPIEYASTAEQSPDVYPNDTVTISSCEIHPQGGPPLGRFLLKRTDQYRWYIAEHEMEDCSVLTTGAQLTDDTRRPGRAHAE